MPGDSKLSEEQKGWQNLEQDYLSRWIKKPKIFSPGHIKHILPLTPYDYTNGQQIQAVIHKLSFYIRMTLSCHASALSTQHQCHWTQLWMGLLTWKILSSWLMKMCDFCLDNSFGGTDVISSPLEKLFLALLHIQPLMPIFIHYLSLSHLICAASAGLFSQ